MHRWIACALALCVAPTARAADSPSPLRAELEAYFEGEWRAGFAFGGVGLATAGAGVALVLQDDPLLQGMSYPILAVSGIELVVGIVLLARTHRQVAGLRARLAADPDRFRGAETTRVQRVVRSFGWVEAIEITLMVGGAVTALCGWGRDEDLVAGIGTGIALQSTAMLTLDLFADARAHRYLGALQRARVAVGSARDALTFGVGGRF